MTTDVESRRLKFYKAARVGITPRSVTYDQSRSAVNPPFAALPAAVGIAPEHGRMPCSQPDVSRRPPHFTQEGEQ